MQRRYVTVEMDTNANQEEAQNWVLDILTAESETDPKGPVIQATYPGEAFKAR